MYVYIFVKLLKKKSFPFYPDYFFQFLVIFLVVFLHFWKKMYQENRHL